VGKRRSVAVGRPDPASTPPPELKGEERRRGERAAAPPPLAYAALVRIWRRG